MSPFVIKKGFSEAKCPKFGCFALEYITILCLLQDVSAQEQILYSLEKALLHLVNFLCPKCSSFLRVPLIPKFVVTKKCSLLL